MLKSFELVVFKFVDVALLGKASVVFSKVGAKQACSIIYQLPIWFSKIFLIFTDATSSAKIETSFFQFHRIKDESTAKQTLLFVLQTCLFVKCYLLKRNPINIEICRLKQMFK